MMYKRLFTVSLLLIASLLALPAYAEEDPFGDSSDDPFGKPGGEDPFGDKADSAASDSVRMEVDPLIGRVRIGAGGAALMRDLVIEGDRGRLEEAPPVYFGASLELDVSLTQIEAWDATMRLLLDGTFGASKQADPAPELGREALVEYQQASARLAFSRALFQHTDIMASFGFHVASLLVEPNNTFTGNRYVGAVVGLDLTQWLFEDLIGLTVRAAALPVIASNTSAGAEGEVDTFGWRLGAGVLWNIVPSYDDPTRTKIDLELRYTHQHFSSQLPASMSWGAADATDMQDILNLMFHISL
jgi:hypothetical protein